MAPYSPARVYRGLRRRLLPYLPPFWYTAVVRGHRIMLLVDSAMDLYRAETYASKEPETLDWIDQYVQPGDVLFDVGANVGLYSLYAAKARQARVYAFEPEAQNVGRLQQHVVRNRLVGRVKPYVLALTDRDALNELQLHGVALEPAAALHAFGDAIDYRGQAFRPLATQGVFGTSLDQLVAQWGLPVPNHIKIDVDGLEPQILDGATGVLRRPELRTVLLEVEGPNLPVADRVPEFGFVEQLRVPTTINGETVGYNCIYTR